MENNSPEEGVVPAQVVGNKVAKREQPGAISQIFSHFTRREFWIDLLDTLVKTAFSGFLIAVGNTLLEFGKKKGGAGNTTIFDSLGTQRPQSPAAQAFSGGYQPQQSYRPSSYPPAPVSQQPSYNTNRDTFPNF